jgi:G:T/U-mismatch repair DNA glycosylase
MEEHPWLRFPEEDGRIQKLIVGSFPPNKFTLYPEHQIIGEDIKFFYGSKANSFWDLFINFFDLELDIYNDEEDLDRFKQYLLDENWGVTDIALNIERKKNSALDSDLIVIDYNLEIITQIFDNNPIQTVFFTSNWVKGKFNNNVIQHLVVNEGIQFFTLISPSPSGLISLDWARSVFPQIDGVSNEHYRQQYYSWIFSKT